jgi:hypothetical protein
VVEGGIIVSLLLTLLVVPSAYVLYDNLTEWLVRVKLNFAAKNKITTEAYGGDDLTPASATNGYHVSDPEPLVGRTNGSNGYHNGNGYSNGNGNGNGNGRSSGKYGKMIIRSRRPDELYVRSVKGEKNGNGNGNGH